jgi:hypothetical protein
MVLIYVAGPVRSTSTAMPGQQDFWGIMQNNMRAMALAREVWARGAAAVSPHGNTIFFQNTLPDEVWLDGDLEILYRCDAVLMTPDWERSAGAREERKFALQHGIPVLYTLDELDTFLGVNKGPNMPVDNNRASCLVCGWTYEGPDPFSHFNKHMDEHKPGTSIRDYITEHDRQLFKSLRVVVPEDMGKTPPR